MIEFKIRLKDYEDEPLSKTEYGVDWNKLKNMIEEKLKNTSLKVVICEKHPELAHWISIVPENVEPIKTQEGLEIPYKRGEESIKMNLALCIDFSKKPAPVSLLLTVYDNRELDLFNKVKNVIRQYVTEWWGN